MEPLVSPFSIYMIEVLGQIKSIAFVITAFCIGLFIVHLYKNNLNIKDTYDKHVVLVWVMITCWVVNIVVPNSQTAADMLVASYVTPDNIKMSGGDLLQYVERLANVIYNRNH